MHKLNIYFIIHSYQLTSVPKSDSTVVDALDINESGVDELDEGAGEAGEATEQTLLSECDFNSSICVCKSCTIV